MPKGRGYPSRKGDVAMHPHDGPKDKPLRQAIKGSSTKVSSAGPRKGTKAGNVRTGRADR